MSTMQPGWYPDPFTRFSRRYHDGRAWTEHVADEQGSQRTDAPVPSPAPAAPTATPAWGQPTTTWQAPPSPPASASPPAFGGSQSAFAGAPGPPPATTPWAPTGDIGAPAPTRAGGSRWVGVVLAVIGAVLVVVGLFVLEWLAISNADANRSQVRQILDIIEGQGGGADLVSRTFFRWGWVVALVIAGLALIAALALNTALRAVAAVLAIGALAWVLFGWLNLRAYLNNDVNAAALPFGGESFSASAGGWLTAAGFALLALGALLGGALRRRRH